MTGFPRYAIYYAASADSALTKFGAECLGYDAHSGAEVPFLPETVGLVSDWAEITADPRKYGFHATLKAPMALVATSSEAQLVEACSAFALKSRTNPVIRPVIDAISGFIALVPAEPVAGLQQLAADCVREFDSFRAPLTAEDRARRKPEKLTERQRDHLDRWGYPYVMEEFRFHMTLTGRLSTDRRGPILDMLRQRFSALRLDAIAIDRIALFRQADANSRFRIIGQWRFPR